MLICRFFYRRIGELLISSCLNCTRCRWLLSTCGSLWLKLNRNLACLVVWIKWLVFRVLWALHGLVRGEFTREMWRKIFLLSFVRLISFSRCYNGFDEFERKRDSFWISYVGDDGLFGGYIMIFFQLRLIDINFLGYLLDVDLYIEIYILLRNLNKL